MYIARCAAERDGLIGVAAPYCGIGSQGVGGTGGAGDVGEITLPGSLITPLAFACALERGVERDALRVGVCLDAVGVESKCPCTRIDGHGLCLHTVGIVFGTAAQMELMAHEGAVDLAARAVSSHLHIVIESGVGAYLGPCLGIGAIYIPYEGAVGHGALLHAHTEARVHGLFVGVGQRIVERLVGGIEQELRRRHGGVGALD